MIKLCSWACAVIVNDDVMVVGTVENMNVDPPSGVCNSETSWVDEMVKSDDTPVVAPNTPATLMMQMTADDTREGEMFSHVRLDALVGVPYATNTIDPPTIVVPDTCTEMSNVVVMNVGVTENSNVCPPSCVNGAEGNVSALTPKSGARPVVAPPPFDTAIVHKIAVPTRAGDVLLHDSDDAAVGMP